MVTVRDYKTIRISKEEARKLIAKLIQDYPDSIYWTKHAMERMDQRELSMTDIYNVLSSPHSRVLSEGEVNAHGVFSYRLETNRMFVVISFSSDATKLQVVTIARKST